MIHIKNREAWAFWPTGVCPGYGHNFGNQYINPEYNFDIKMNITFLGKYNDFGCIFSIMPRYISLNWHNENELYVNFNEGGHQYTKVDTNIKVNETFELTIGNKKDTKFYIKINDKERFTNPTLGSFEDPHMMLGVDGFPCDMDNPSFAEYKLNSFKIFFNNNLIGDNNLENIIHYKSFDKTGNLNFLHRIGNKDDYDKNG